MSLNKINEKFIEACTYGNYESMKSIYEQHYLKPNKLINKFNSFFSLSNYKIEILNPYFNDNSAFNRACQNGHKDIVKFLLERKEFIKKFTHADYAVGIDLASDSKYSEVVDLFFQNKISCNVLLNEGTSGTCAVIKNSMQNNDLKTFETLFPYISKYISGNHYNLDIFNSIRNGIKSACVYGNEEILKFFMDNIDQKNFEFTDEITPQLQGQEFDFILSKGFFIACEQGQLNIAKYFIKEHGFLIEPEYYNKSFDFKTERYSAGRLGIFELFKNGNLDVDIMRCIVENIVIQIDIIEGLQNNPIEISNPDVLNYLFLEAEMDKDHEFMSIIANTEMVKKILDYKYLSQDMLELPINKTAPTKKLKV